MCKRPRNLYYNGDSSDVVLVHTSYRIAGQELAELTIRPVGFAFCRVFSVVFDWGYEFYQPRVLLFYCHSGLVSNWLHLLIEFLSINFSSSSYRHISIAFLVWLQIPFTSIFNSRYLPQPAHIVVVRLYFFHALDFVRPEIKILPRNLH